MIIEVYADPSHSFAKVSIKNLIKYKVIDKISKYSYVRKDFAYLEEDRDLTIYLMALKENCVDYSLRYHYTNRQSKIRNYSSFNTRVIQ